MCYTQTQVYEGAQAGDWIRKNPDECGCIGSGWFCSNVDTWHKCFVHPPACSDVCCHPESSFDFCFSDIHGPIYIPPVVDKVVIDYLDEDIPF